MVFMKSSLLAIALATLNVNAYFLQGVSPGGVRRLDPIVDPGNPMANHSHLIFGSDAFAPSVTSDILRAGSCTGIPIAEDHSNYWVPQLYFQWKNGSFTSVGGGMCKLNFPVKDYLFDENAKVTAFPDDFRMISGTHPLRDYDPTSFAQKAVTFLCLDFNGVSKTFNHMPVNNPCPSGTRAQINFPSCWDGKNLDSSDHKSHVAFPSGGPDTGTCEDPNFPVTIPRIFMEIYWSTQDFTSVLDQALFPDQPFTYSQGDGNGYGYHADFYNGWEHGILQNAIDGCDCTDAGFGDPTCCSEKGIFTYRTTVPDCPIVYPLTEQVTGTLDELPGGNIRTGLVPLNTGEIYSNGTWELVVPLSQQPPPVVLPGVGNSVVAPSSSAAVTSSVKATSTIKATSTVQATSTVKATSIVSTVKASSTPVSKPATSSPVLIVSASSSVKPSSTAVSGGGASSSSNGNSGSSGGDSWSTGSSSSGSPSSSSTSTSSSGASGSGNQSSSSNSNSGSAGSEPPAQNSPASASSSSNNWGTSSAVQPSQPSATHPTPSPSSSSSGGVSSSSQSSNTGSSGSEAVPAQNQPSSGSANSGTSNSPQPIVAPAPPKGTSSANASASTSRNADKCKNRHASSSLESRAESLVVKRSALQSHHHRSKSFNRVRNTGDMQI